MLLNCFDKLKSLSKIKILTENRPTNEDEMCILYMMYYTSNKKVIICYLKKLNTVLSFLF